MHGLRGGPCREERLQAAAGKASGLQAAAQLPARRGVADVAAAMTEVARRAFRHQARKEAFERTSACCSAFADDAVLIPETSRTCSLCGRHCSRFKERYAFVCGGGQPKTPGSPFADVPRNTARRIERTAKITGRRTSSRQRHVTASRTCSRRPLSFRKYGQPGRSMRTHDAKKHPRCRRRHVILWCNTEVRALLRIHSAGEAHQHGCETWRRLQ